MKIEIKTHSGDIDVVDIDNYIPLDVLNELENTEKLHIALGNNIYSKIDVKSIKPVEE